MPTEYTDEKTPFNRSSDNHWGDLTLDLTKPRPPHSRLLRPTTHSGGTDDAAADDAYTVDRNWWHRSRATTSVLSVSVLVGAPVTIASLISPWVAKAFLPFTFAALWIGTIETFIHVVRQLRMHGMSKLCVVASVAFVAILGHGAMFAISLARGLHASTPLAACVVCSTGAYVLGFGLMLAIERWWYAITPAQLLVLIVPLHAMGLVLVTLL